MALAQGRGAQQQLAAAANPMSTQQGRILSLVHGCARDQSSGENYLEQLKQKNADLTSQLVKARELIAEKKQQKKCTEEELKSLQVELAAAEATVQARQARVECKQLDISKARSQLEKLKENDDKERDKFIQLMLELNKSLLDIQ